MTTADLRDRYRKMRSAELLEEVRVLAAEFAGGTGRAAELAAAASILQYRYSFPLHQGPRGPRPDSGLPDVDLMRRVVFQANGFLAVPAGEVRAAMGNRVTLNLCSAPDPLPVEDDALVLLYNPLAGVASLVGRLTRGEDATDALEDVEGRAVHNRPPYEEW
ncbi:MULTISPECIES: hypothetical protein [unclassified Streptomyces]|uniref:hypothetical protein n=1 Tax=unclassified Streptomyces TaxID=2593676 RepID=UPI000DAC74EE|nr:MULTISPECIES: hypothetical protein [unclassified Streptomyces]PZT74506.1 hypothetical protein DNK55_20625 [Streptomyces sp. AC1-42T]PZT82508.1 hypothetical protein DNK56_10820 [Streptomyces sp. AC1-42W]